MFITTRDIPLILTQSTSKLLRYESLVLKQLKLEYGTIEEFDGTSFSSQQWRDFIYLLETKRVVNNSTTALSNLQLLDFVDVMDRAYYLHLYIIFFSQQIELAMNFVSNEMRSSFGTDYLKNDMKRLKRNYLRVLAIPPMSVDAFVIKFWFDFIET